jgi:hypothetical protein
MGERLRNMTPEERAQLNYNACVIGCSLGHGTTCSAQCAPHLAGRFPTYSAPASSQPQQFQSAYKECQFDTQCMLPQKCVKAGNALTGVCGEVVNAYGVPEQNAKAATCHYDLDCGIGWVCYKQGYNIEGVCAKK